MEEEGFELGAWMGKGVINELGTQADVKSSKAQHHQGECILLYFTWRVSFKDSSIFPHWGLLLF